MTNRVNEIIIASEDAVLCLVPAFGGRVATYRVGDVDVLRPMPTMQFDPDTWPRAGAYPMVPYHNRIEGAVLEFRGTKHSLSPSRQALPHTLHGPAHREPWDCNDRTASSALLSLRHAADEHWPWSFEATQKFALAPRQLTLKMSVTNSAETPMPAGLGWHPYFDRVRSLKHDAAYRWPLRKDYVPFGDRLAVMHHLPMPISGTDYLSAWTEVIGEQADLTWSLTASPAMGHLVLHEGEGDYVCVEPVSHLANGFNFDALGVLGTGTRVLAPGHTLSATITLSTNRNR